MRRLLGQVRTPRVWLACNGLCARSTAKLGVKDGWA